MPYFDAAGNELVSLPGTFPGNPPSVLAELKGGAARSIGKVFTRRRVQDYLMLSLAAASVATGGAYSYGNPASFVDWSEALLFVTISGGTGSPAGLGVVLQFWDADTGQYGSHPIAPPALQSLTGTAVLGVGAYTNLGSYLRVGLTATTAYTGGTLKVWLRAKG